MDERRRCRLVGEAITNRYAIRLLLPKAGVRWIDIGVTIVPWDGGPGTLTFFSDVTERKALEARLTSSLQERAATLESSFRRQSELNELRSRFVSMTSHEFRTPLASIQSSAELLRDYGERLPAPEKEQIFQTIEPRNRSWMRLSVPRWACQARREDAARLCAQGRTTPHGAPSGARSGA